MQGLIIKALVGTPVFTGTPHQAVHLDSILAYAATKDLPKLKQGEVRLVEIPGLKKVWEDKSGKPLWACSMLYAVEPETGSEYAHRRYPSHRAHLAKKQSANLSAGQYKESRRSIRTTSAMEWVAMAIGDKDIIASMLDRVSSIGSRSAVYGHVLKWSVEESDEVTLEKILERRPVPAEYIGEDLACDPFAPWTPPYWYHPWFSPCRSAKDVFE